LFDLFHYYKNKGECDFLVYERGEVIMCIQVCWEINSENLKRELAGIEEAMQYKGCKKGIILTLQQTDKFNNIRVVPVNQWLLELRK